ncbi:MAG: histone-like nucleoid-structuring protein Lsr2 [Acidimicrobiales bacterium]
MAQSTVVYLTDDIDGSDADETIKFGLDGKTYEIDLNKKHASALRKAFKQYVDAGRSVGRQAGRATGSGRAAGSPTLFSQLDSTEKDRFRKWADMPNARRIGDARVQEWIKAGKP